MRLCSRTAGRKNHSGVHEEQHQGPPGQGRRPTTVHHHALVQTGGRGEAADGAVEIEHHHMCHQRLRRSLRSSAPDTMRQRPVIRPSSTSPCWKQPSKVMLLRVPRRSTRSRVVPTISTSSSSSA